jgi:hypothetical protein
MTKSQRNYAIFEADEIVASRGHLFERAIPAISSDYFVSNPRFKSLGRISSPNLVDYLDVYEEGDRWVLTITKAVINGSVQYLFLPFAADLSSSDHRSAQSRLGKTAFGYQTSSSFYGTRQWKVFDAFADYMFFQKLANLFLPWEGVSQNHVNAYIDVKNSGIGNFIFRTKHEMAKPLWLNKKVSYELTESGLSVKYGDEFELEIYQILPTDVDIEALESSSEIEGWIGYSGKKEFELLIGILYKSSKRIS